MSKNETSPTQFAVDALGGGILGESPVDDMESRGAPESVCGKRKLGEPGEAEINPESKRAGGAGGAGMLGHLLVVRSSIGQKERNKLAGEGYVFVNVTSRACDPRKLGGTPGAEYVKLLSLIHI